MYKPRRQYMAAGRGPALMLAGIYTGIYPIFGLFKHLVYSAVVFGRILGEETTSTHFATDVGADILLADYLGLQRVSGPAADGPGF